MTVSEKIAQNSLDEIMYSQESISFNDLTFYLTVVRDNYGSVASQDIINKIVRKLWLQENSNV